MKEKATYDELFEKVKTFEKEIDRLKGVELALRQSENRYRAVVEDQTELICRFRPDYTLTFVNNAICRYFSKEYDDMIGTTFIPLVHEAERVKVIEFYSSLNPETPFGLTEHKVVLQSGEIRWQQWSARATFEPHGNLIEFQAVGRDITDRVRAEEALRESQERYRIVTKHAADGILVIQNRRLVFVNDAFVAMCGYEEVGQLIGRKIDGLIDEAFREKIINYLEMLAAGRTTESIFRGKIRRLDGRELWAEGLHTVIQWERHPAILTTFRDITEAKLREIETTRETQALRQQNIRLASTIKDRYRLGDLVGKSNSMQEVYEQILGASATNANVVIYGESGTGKELVAKAIHDHSDRSGGSFVPVNCGAIPEHLMESEFFGHKKGAFTGAGSDKNGFLDFANGGILFLDEVGTISLSLQVKLLRAVEGGGHTPLGSSQMVKSDFRVIAATNRPLMEMVKEGLIREDFFFRIHIVPIYIPPLRERKEDIVLLVDHFMGVFGQGKTTRVLPGKIVDAFMEYEWPGNVRELQNVLQRYLTVGRLEFASGWRAKALEPKTNAEQLDVEGENLQHKIENFEKQLILQSLDSNRWHRSNVAADLGITTRTLFNKMKKLGIK